MFCMGTSAVFSATSPSSHEVADAIRSLDQVEPERYLVKWEGVSWKFSSTTYEVTKIGFEAGGRPTLEIKKGRGGTYIIDSNPMGNQKSNTNPQLVRQERND